MNREEWTMNNLEFLETSVGKVYFLNKYTSWKGREEIIEEFYYFLEKEVESNNYERKLRAKITREVLNIFLQKEKDLEEKIEADYSSSEE